MFASKSQRFVLFKWSYLRCSNPVRKCFQKIDSLPQKPRVLRPILFTTGVAVGSLVGCSILQYERVKGVLKSNQGSYWNKKIRKSLHIRQKFNTWWNNLHEGHKIASGIIGINVLVFGAWQIPRYRHFMVKWFTSSINFRVSSPLVFSCFSHSEVWHIGANMFVLWSFSPLIHSMLGTEQFIAFYLTGGTFSSLVSYLYRFAKYSTIPSLGASGALLAVLAACCIKNPDAQLSILFLPFFTFSAQTALYSIISIDIAGLLFSWKLFDHAGHLGGTLFGIWYILQGHEWTWEQRSSIIHWWHEIRKMIGKL